MMIKKLVVIILLLVVILCNVQICYADYDTTQFLYNSQNSNLVSRTITYNNQNTAINNLYSNGNRSIISRYSKQLLHVKYTFDYMQILYQFRFSSGGSLNEFKNYFDNLPVVIDVYGSNSLNITNLDYSNISWTKDYYVYSNVAEYRFTFTGVLEFDMPYTNSQLLKASSGSDLYFANIGLRCVDTRFSLSGHTYYIDRIYLTAPNQFNYKVEYTFNDVLSSIDGFYIFNQIHMNCGDPNFNNNFAIDSNATVMFNNSNTTYNVVGVMSGCSVLASTLSNTKITQASYYYKYNSDYPSYGYTFNDEYDLNITISTFSPILYTNSEYFIQASSNGSMTPLKLQYYDCKWYELHYQIANAFIFMITEFPLISDITNLVYSLFVMIKSSFDVLINFNGFGVMFGVGMFAVVFAFILKLIIGD